MSSTRSRTQETIAHLTKKKSILEVDPSKSLSSSGHITDSSSKADKIIEQVLTPTPEKEPLETTSRGDEIANRFISKAKSSFVNSPDQRFLV